MDSFSRPSFATTRGYSTPEYALSRPPLNIYPQPFPDQYQRSPRPKARKIVVGSASFDTFTIMAAASNPEDMEEFQRLSDRYQPDLEVLTTRNIQLPTDVNSGPPGQPQIAHRRSCCRVCAGRSHLRYEDQGMDSVLYERSLLMLCRLWLGCMTPTVVLRAMASVAGEVLS